MKQGLTVGGATREAGVGVETIRFYERRRLVPQPLKPEGAGIRLYPNATAERVRFIRMAQGLDFSLREIHDLLELRAAPSTDCSEIRDLAATKLDEVRWKVRRLQGIGTALKRLIAACPGSDGLQSCSIMNALTSHPSGRCLGEGK
ncbi:MerR family DNA-binding protein [Paeniroseomonas aquatica]|jgi:MerR family copper efflux transcriptional regulator|uniref:MerR family DNA-binding protein n=1 Tax=Paeniroseomonas aquatica TaxID=373043 RepID=A0ABT8A1C3_9PROT|nr:MerR family DNA-binding protein [Paeniroseomonas aquatica]MDN3563537.1 MerR family DNA-binding protein [Paeniroseomonas aquatica]